MKNYYKILFLFSLFAIFNINAYSKKQANIWYFGENAGLDFNNDTIFAELPVGDSLVVETNIHLNFVENYSSMYPNYLYSYVRAYASYFNQCGDSLNEYPPIPSIYHNDCDDDMYVIAPLDIDNQDTISVSLCTGMDIPQRTIDCPLNQFSTILTLPQGYTIASDVVWSKWGNFYNDTISWSSSNDSIILEGGEMEGCYNFDLALNNDCNSVDSIQEVDTITYSLMYECATDACNREVGSYSFIITSHYPDCGFDPTSCIYTTDFSVQRTTLGWTDATKTTPVTDTTPGIRLDAAYVFDNIRVEAKGEVIEGYFNNVHIQLIYSLPDSINILTFSDAEVIINGDTCSLSAPTLTIIESNPVRYILDFDLFYCIDPSWIETGDLVNISANFVIKEPAYLDNLDSDILSRFTARHYAIFNGDTLGCATRSQDFTFMYPGYEFTTKTDSVSHCSKQVGLYWKIDDFCDRFPNEFRNPVRLYSPVEVFIPDGYEYIDSSGYFMASSSLYNLMPAYTDTTPSNGALLIFNQNWPLSETRYDFSQDLLPATDCPAGGYVGYNISYVQYDYADTAYKELINASFPLELYPSSGTVLPGENVHLDLLPHAVSLTSDTVTFDMIICDSDTIPLWVALRNEENAVDYLHIIEVSDSLNPDTLQLSAYTDGITQWFMVDSNYHSCKRYRVITEYEACTESSVEIYTGRLCSDSSANIAAAFCRPANGTFRIDPDKAEMQTVFTAVASDGIDECTPSAYEIDIINSQFREITGIDVSIYVPDGFEIDSAGIQYPSNSWFRALPSPDNIDSNLYGWTIDDVDTLIGTYGLTGIDSIEKFRLKLLIWFNVDSAFDFNVDTPLITFNISGSPACNNFAQFTHQADPMLEKPLSADFYYTPVDVFEGAPVLFTSIDTTGVHLWIIYGQDAPLSADTMNVSNPVYIFDSAGIYTVIHIISKDCNSGFASDTVVLQALNV
ncbi:MAG: hypothetical protein HY738_22990, partial [Bacteroidia bacterium]|nr:hypothetical protein [Bacteroidia bacterium]